MTNLFRIHVRPHGGNTDMYTTFQYCLANGVLGVGWRVDEINETTDWEVYERLAATWHDSIQQPRYIYGNIKQGDLVWTRDPDGKYFLARIKSGWEYWTTPEGREMDIDIANIFRCVFHEVWLDAVPDVSSQASVFGDVLSRRFKILAYGRIPSICGTATPANKSTMWTWLIFPTSSRCSIPKKRKTSCFSICKATGGMWSLTRARAILFASSSCSRTREPGRKRWSKSKVAMCS